MKYPPQLPNTPSSGSQATQPNPLIEALGPFPQDVSAMVELLSIKPPLPNEDDRLANHIPRIKKLAAIDQAFCPTARDLSTAIDLHTMIVEGYENRLPSASYWRMHKAQAAAVAGKRTNRGDAVVAELTKAIIGISGSGKTTFLNILLSSIPQVVEHDQSKNPLLPHHQVCWIKLTCPVNGTPKAFITAFFVQLDRLLGTTYTKQYARQNDDERIEKMALVARAHFLGLLVIDEIQNLAGAGDRRDRRLLKLFVNISGTLGVPLVFVGTPKSQSVLTRELADARRMMGSYWLPFAENDPDWQMILETLWEYQYLRTVTPLTEKLRKKVHEISMGIPAIAKHLFRATQKYLIMNSGPHGLETITDEVLQLVYDQEMQSVAPALTALRTQKGLEVYDDMLPQTGVDEDALQNTSTTIETLAKIVFNDSVLATVKKLGKLRGHDIAGEQT